MRWIPFLICTAIGFAAGVVISFKRSQKDSASSNWEAKYYKLEQRFRDLTRRLNELDEKADPAKRRRWENGGNGDHSGQE